MEMTNFSVYMITVFINYVFGILGLAFWGKQGEMCTVIKIVLELYMNIGDEDIPTIEMLSLIFLALLLKNNLCILLKSLAGPYPLLSFWPEALLFCFLFWFLKISFCEPSIDTFALYKYLNTTNNTRVPSDYYCKLWHSPWHYCNPFHLNHKHCW